MDGGQPGTPGRTPAFMSVAVDRGSPAAPNPRRSGKSGSKRRAGVRDSCGCGGSGAPGVGGAPPGWGRVAGWGARCQYGWAVGKLSAMRTLVVNGDGLTVEDVVDVARGEARAELAESVAASMERSRSVVAAAIAGDAPVYGVNTGFGALAD